METDQSKNIRIQKEILNSDDSSHVMTLSFMIQRDPIVTSKVLSKIYRAYVPFKVSSITLKELEKQTDLKKIHNILKAGKVITNVNRRYNYKAYEEENENIYDIVSVSGDTVTYDGIKSKELINLLIEKTKKEARKNYREDYMIDIENNLDPEEYYFHGLEEDDEEREKTIKDNLEEDIKSLNVYILNVRYGFYNDTFYVAFGAYGDLFLKKSYDVIANVKLKIKGGKVETVSLGGVHNSNIANFLFMERPNFVWEFKSFMGVDIGIRVDYQIR